MTTDTLAAGAMYQGLMLAAVLFCLGLVGLLVRRNIIFMLMCIEICTNAAALAFVIAGAHWGSADGQVMYIFVITLAAAEVAIALALVLQFYRRKHTVDVDQLNGMRG